MDVRFREAHMEGKLIGVRSIDNYFRQPYGNGWVLAGDAGYLKDPCTGLGVGDALQQSILLAKSLEEWFHGTPWEAAMGAFHRKRDDTMLPSYETTVATISMRDMGPADSAILKAILTSPMWTRSLASAIPQLRLQVYEGATQRRIERIATLFTPATALPAIAAI